MFILKIDPIKTNGDIKHEKTSWQVSLSPDFNDDDVVFQSLEDTENLTQIRVPLPLTENDLYYTRTKIHFSDDTESDWSRPNIVTRNATGFTFSDTVLVTPELSIDFDKRNAPLGGFTVKTTPFTLFMGIGKHRSTNWIIEDTSGNTIWKRLDDKHNLTEIRIPSNILEPGKMYTIKACHISDTNAYSNYGKLRIITNPDLVRDPIYQYDKNISLLKLFETNTALLQLLRDYTPVDDLLSKIIELNIESGLKSNVIDKLNNKLSILRGFIDKLVLLGDIDDVTEEDIERAEEITSDILGILDEIKSTVYKDISDNEISSIKKVLTNIPNRLRSILELKNTNETLEKEIEELKEKLKDYNSIEETTDKLLEEIIKLKVIVNMQEALIEKLTGN